ncbi:PH domain-containing protein [Pauljensenia hongkongensis]|uniref:PH domain protein n=1 Tax=Pauljensenia hongkongensis TaxID=178339 RepID=A0A1D8B2C2_9ACTO|nr:PH domain-containing protein [Pauljensenia hongkongensis]AOS47301.1 PH domain protein [Pauljensenia hongkongensis]EFW09958.1 hypothetical protein HMPREF9005_1054 [Actinomyces sp. oral taxon 178 str. F0338]
MSAESRSITADGVAADAWHRVHPVSPIINAWQVIAALVAIITYRGVSAYSSGAPSGWEILNGIAEGFHLRGVLMAAFAVVIAVLVVSGLYSWLQWRATAYAVDGGAVWFRSGIVFRTNRHARLDRIQSVDIHLPLLGRILGLGRLSIEVAGGAGSSFTIGFLRATELDELRAHILALAAGLEVGSAGEGAQPGAPARPAAESPGRVSGALEAEAARGAARRGAFTSSAPIAPENVLYEVGAGPLIGSLLLTVPMMVLLVVLVAVVAASAWAIAARGAVAAPSLFAVVPLVVASGSVLWGRFNAEFAFTAAASPDGIRIRRGLTDSRNQTIPPGRIHAIEIRQPLLWRLTGWYRVTMTQAGNSVKMGKENNGGNNELVSARVLLPVGSRAQAELAVWMVVQDLGVPDPAAFVDSVFAPTHAGADAHFTRVPHRARLVDPLVRRRRAYALTGSLFVIRDGWLTRRCALIPLARIQSTHILQGPVERRLDVATVRADLVPGVVSHTARHVDRRGAQLLWKRLEDASRVRREAEPPEKWMRRALAARDHAAAPQGEGA